VCRVLGEVLPSVLTCFRPDIVLYDAGVDTHMHDSLGKLNLTDKGLQRRELQVRKVVAWGCPFGSSQTARQYVSRWGRRDVTVH